MEPKIGSPVVSGRQVPRGPGLRAWLVFPNAARPSGKIRQDLDVHVHQVALVE